MEPQAKRGTEPQVDEYEKDGQTPDIQSGPRSKDVPPHTTSIRRVPTSTSQQANAISLHAVEPVSVRLEHLTVSVDDAPNALVALVSKKKKSTDRDHVKTILDDVSAEMPSGTLTAIIGGSGSGKTSLLNQMSGRMQGKRLSTSGRTLFNEREDPTRIRSAYVIQQDILIPTLTVRETLTYAAQLRLSTLR